MPSHLDDPTRLKASITLFLVGAWFGAGFIFGIAQLASGR